MDRALRRLSLSAIAAISIAGCNSTTKSGSIGSTLSGEGVTVTVQRVDSRPPHSANAFNGPSPGDRLFGARVRVCSTNGGAIKEYAFTLVLSTGAQTHAAPAGRNYRQAFNELSTGCQQGWILFLIPKRGSAEEIRFEFNNSGSGPASEGPSEAHVHFSWKL